MNPNHLPEVLFDLIRQQPDTQKAIDYLQQQAEAFRQTPSKAVFYRVFTALPRFVGRQPIQVRPEQSHMLDTFRSGFSVDGWTLDRLCRVWWLLQLPSDDETHYVSTITELFRAGELNELVALYSALPVLAYPEAWRFQATEGVRNNIGDVQSAIMLHNPYPADYLDEASWNQLVMKAFFTEKDVTQIIGLHERANDRLAQILRDYIAERRAAGRSIPAHVEELIQ